MSTQVRPPERDDPEDLSYVGIRIGIGQIAPPGTTSMMHVIDVSERPDVLAMDGYLAKILHQQSTADGKLRLKLRELQPNTGPLSANSPGFCILDVESMGQLRSFCVPGDHSEDAVIARCIEQLKAIEPTSLAIAVKAFLYSVPFRTRDVDDRWHDAAKRLAPFE